jgi:prepilin-type N-terminal cleavage/methylation domain-containing protein
MQKYLRNNKGFTLVEVIVVAVIVLILAAVAIPLYNGYIRDSRASTASSVAGTIASAMGACIQSERCDEAAAVAAFDAVSGGGLATFGGTDNDANQVRIPDNFDVTITADDVFVCHNGNGCGDDAGEDCCSELMIFNM